MSNSYYSSYLLRSNFLSPDGNSVFKETDLLSSIGFVEQYQFDGKVVAEIGAGAGRLTSALAAAGMVGRAKRYLVVEPSDGIQRIKEAGHPPNITYFNCTLDQFSEERGVGTVDYLIVHGVIPHLPEGDLATTIAKLGSHLSENGVLHIVSSYYGYPKSAAHRAHSWCTRHTWASGLCAWVTAGLQVLSSLGPYAWRSAYQQRFIYSPQLDWRGKLEQQKEFYRVSPYNIRWGYSDYHSALAQNGLQVTGWFPYSIALLANRSSSGVGWPAPSLSDGSIAILGTDWTAKWVAKTLNRQDIRFVNDVSQLNSEQQVVVAYDYTTGEPYVSIVKKCEAMGYKLGENLFIFQMLV